MSAQPKNRDIAPLASPVLLLYGLALTSGLAIYTASDGLSLQALPALWIGSIAGTALGVMCALRNLRLWVVLLVAMVTGLITALLAWSADGLGPLQWVIVPSTICAYLALGDRTAPAAFWWPEVVWMFTILDHVADARRRQTDLEGLLLLGAVAMLFLAFLAVREQRRAALWSRVSSLQTAKRVHSAVLHERPGASFLRAVWGAAFTAVSLALTVWLAPSLWRYEHVVAEVESRALVDGDGGLPCCPTDSRNEERIGEYLGLVRAHATDLRPGFGCRLCNRAVAMATPSGPVGWRASARHDSFAHSATGTVATAMPSTAPPVAQDNSRSSVDPLASTGAPAHTATPPDPRPVQPPLAQPQPSPPPPPKPPVAKPSVPVPTVAARPVAHHPVVEPQRTLVVVAPSWGRPLIWALVVFALASLFALLLRPLRRAVALRHLRRPFWPEAAAERVSSWWQLALVGLRDGGHRVRVGESPHDFARRVASDDLGTCSTILERTRCGLGLDDGDLAAMAEAAERTFRAARRGLGPIGRVAAWLRWPLV